MAYQRTYWLDHIVAKDTHEVLQVGTPIDAIRLNNIEEGITNASSTVDSLVSDMEKTVTQEVFTYELSKKVDAADGRDLSTNDYDDVSKQKLDALPTAEELESSLTALSNTTDAKIEDAIDSLKGILNVEGDTASVDLVAMSTAITTLQNKVTSLESKVSTLETWKTSVLNGSTVVVIKTS